MTSWTLVVVTAALVTSLPEAMAECPSGFTALHNHCYKFDKTWLQYGLASRQCHMQKGYLFRADESGEKSEIVKFIETEYPDVDEWRIGGYPENGKWFWSPGEVIQDHDWHNNMTARGPTLLMVKTDQGYKFKGTHIGSPWKNEVPKEFSYPYICETETICEKPEVNVVNMEEYDCPSGLVNLGHKCYKFDLRPSQGRPAIKRCTEVNSHLLTLEDKAEDDLISEYLQHHHPGVSAWRIGGYMNKGKSYWPWYWNNSTEILCYSNWETKELPLRPTIIMVKTESGYKWRGEFWGSPWKNEMFYPFICEADALNRKEPEDEDCSC